MFTVFDNGELTTTDTSSFFPKHMIYMYMYLANLSKRKRTGKGKRGLDLL